MRFHPAARFMCVFDDSTNEMIACGHWDIYPNERTQAEVDKIASIPPVPSDANAEAWNDFFGNFSERRKTVMGNRPVGILHTLVTHPDHHRRGAGALLLQSFVDEVDREGLQGYLEASEMGKPLYTRFGFKEFSVKEFPLEKYGGSGMERNTVMLREVKSLSLP